MKFEIIYESKNGSQFIEIMDHDALGKFDYFSFAKAQNLVVRKVISIESSGTSELYKLIYFNKTSEDL